ncbi:MAG: hypothetical protein JNK48_10000 [Bryobacterales bacterium]|nr:hypothetical protein [Bryobacterales bacterium]
MDTCPQEHAVAAAIRAGALPDDLAGHAASCRVCAEALLIASFLHLPEEEAPVPPACLVYRRAELRARREQAERALRPVRAMEIAAMVLLCVLALALGVISGSLVLPALAAGFLATLGVAGWALRAYLG